MSQDQLSLFAEEESDQPELFKKSIQTEKIHMEFHSWSFFRVSFMASFDDSKSPHKSHPIWITQNQTQKGGSCHCLEFAKKGTCSHTQQLSLWVEKNFSKNSQFIGQRFEQSHWIGLGQKWFQEWKNLIPKVKLPSILQFHDASGKLRIEFKSKHLGEILSANFYGLLIHLNDEHIRKLRIKTKVSKLDWDNFYHQNLDSTELNLKSQNMNTLAMEFDSSILGSIMRHGFVFFEEDHQNPSQLMLAKEDFSLQFHP